MVPYTVHNVAPVCILFYHLVHRVNVVLQVGVHADAGVAFVLYRHETGKQRILMTSVARQR